MRRTVLLCSVFLVPLGAQVKELDLKPSPTWVDTGIDLKAGDTVRFTATGQLK